MIGFIALAGIVVRNSILLVDFIKAKLAENAPLRQALLDAGAVRFKPIALTAISTMAGAAFILADPIFQGLAVSLLFGLLSSTLLTVLVIPAAYIWSSALSAHHRSRLAFQDGERVVEPAACRPVRRFCRRSCRLPRLSVPWSQKRNFPLAGHPREAVLIGLASSVPKPV